MHLYPAIYNARIIKSTAELEVIRFSIKATSEGHVEIMKKCKPGLRESQLACHFRHISLFNYNARFKPYNDSVGCGRNGAVIHYDRNDKIIKDGDLVVFDCGNKIHGYCSDLTTTFPANGKFTKKQRLYMLKIIERSTKWY